MKTEDRINTLVVSHVEKLAPGLYEASGYILETGQRIGNSETIGMTNKQAVYKLWEYACAVYGKCKYPKTNA